MKKRKAVGCLFSILAVCAIAKSCSAVGADVSAAVVAHAANGQTVTLTSAQTVALFGQTIDCKYLTRPAGIDTWVDGQFTYIATEIFPTTQGAYKYFSPVGQDFGGRPIALYSMTYPADLSISQNSVAMLKLQTSVDLSAVDYIDGAIIQNTGSVSLLDVDSVPYVGLGVNYIHTDFGNFDMLRRDVSGTTDYNYAGWFYNSINVKCTIIPYYLNTASTQTASIGWAQCSCVRNSENRIIIGLVAPILSDNWILSGNTGAGEGSIGGGSDSGCSSGGGSVDMSGVESRLDSVLDKLDTIIAEMQDDDDNDESSGGGSDSVGSLDSIPDSFDFDAVFAAADSQGVLDYPEFAIAPSSSSGSGGASDSPSFVPAQTSPGSVSVDDIDIGGGVGGIWWLVRRIFSAAPWFPPLAMFSLALAVAHSFIFRGD